MWVVLESSVCVVKTVRVYGLGCGCEEVVAVVVSVWYVCVVCV